MVPIAKALFQMNESKLNIRFLDFWLEYSDLFFGNGFMTSHNGTLSRSYIPVN